MILATTLATVCNLPGQSNTCTNDADTVSAAAALNGGPSAGNCSLQNGIGSASAKSVRIANPWPAADAFDGYLRSHTTVSSDNFRMSLYARTEARHGWVPITGGAAFMIPNGGAVASVFLNAREVTLRFPQLTTTNCEVEVTYRAAFNLLSSGVSGGILSASSWFRVSLTPFATPSSDINFVESRQLGQLTGGGEPPVYSYRAGATNGIATFRIRTPLRTNGVGEVFATYELSGAIVAEVTVYPGHPMIGTEVYSGASCDMYFVSARVICPGEIEVPTTIQSVPRNSTDILDLSLPVTPTATEMYAEPADANAFLGEGVAFAVSPALMMSLSNDTPVQVQWYRSGDPAQLLPGETNAVLTLLNTALSDSGSYYAVLTNDSGSVTSRVATLTVSLHQPFLKLDLVSGQRVLKVGGAVGSTYRIEHTENLSSTNWNSVVEFMLDASPFTYEDTNAPLARGFYRAVRLP